MHDLRFAVEGPYADCCFRYVIANNTIESAPDTPAINYNILAGILPKVPINVITIEQALAALNHSGPAIY